jgi:hypothetical protein
VKGDYWLGSQWVKLGIAGSNFTLSTLPRQFNQRPKEREMAKNMGGGDRIIRAIIGIGLMGSLMLNNNIIEKYGFPWIMLVGLIFLLTAAFGWCPAYLPFGIKTKKS